MDTESLRRQAAWDQLDAAEQSFVRAVMEERAEEERIIRRMDAQIRLVTIAQFATPVIIALIVALLWMRGG